MAVVTEVMPLPIFILLLIRAYLAATVTIGAPLYTETGYGSLLYPSEVDVRIVLSHLFGDVSQSLL